MTIATTLAKTATAVYVDKPVSAHDVSIQNNNFTSCFIPFDLVFVYGRTRGASKLAVESNIPVLEWTFLTNADKGSSLFRTCS